MSDPRTESAAAAMWEQRPMMRTADGAPRPWAEVPGWSYGARYRGQAEVALAAADAVDPLRGDGVIVIEIPEEPMGDVVHDYTFSPYGRGEEDSPEWHRTMDGQEWKGHKGGGKDYLTWPELVRRWGPLTVPVN